MRVLFVTEQFPYPLDTGGNVRTFHLLKGLARAHEVSLIATSRGPVADAHRREMAGICRDIAIVPVASRGIVREAVGFAASVVRRAPYSLTRHRFERVRRQVVKANGGFDAVHFNHLDAALYQTAVHSGTPCVLDEHNVVTNQARTTAASERRLSRRMIFAHEYRKLRRFEADLCNRMSLCLACSEVDAHSLRTLGVTRPIAVIPNGVDLTYFASGMHPPRAPPEIVFVGTLDYEPCERGVWFFCTEILPLVHAEMPQVRFVAIGRNPSARLRDLARADSRIELTGRVDDVRPYVHGASACVVPLLSGSGTRLKILEAFALGAPVVSTAIGAEGIECASGEHLLLADEPRHFAESVLELLRHPERGEKLGAAGRRLVEQRYGWEAISSRLLEEYRRLPAHVA